MQLYASGRRKGLSFPAGRAIYFGIFSHTEDFAGIIERATGRAPRSLEVIPTGWTNIVILAEMPDGQYFFRFPRDPFWAEMMPKDHAFVRYIRPRTSFEVPDMKLLRDEGRAFSMHRKIEGRSLQSAFADLDEGGMRRAADGVARFVAEMLALPPDECPEECNMKSSLFLKRLAETHFDRCEEVHHKRLVDAERASPHVVHGDLNPGNIIVDDKGSVVGIIDFCFAGIGGEMMDISRVVGRSPEAFRAPFMDALSNQGVRLDMDEVSGLVDTWAYVEAGYIGFMRANHPEIVLPEASGGVGEPQLGRAEHLLGQGGAILGAVDLEGGERA